MRQSIYLNYSFGRLLCNAPIQPYFDYGCKSWYALLSKALKTKFQIAQNKYICFCFELLPRDHINPSHFRKLNWFLVEHRVEIRTSTTVFKYSKRTAPFYLNMFMPLLNNCNTRSQNTKTAATTSSVMHRLKKEIVSKLQE